MSEGTSKDERFQQIFILCIVSRGFMIKKKKVEEAVT